MNSRCTERDTINLKEKNLQKLAQREIWSAQQLTSARKRNLIGISTKKIMQKWSKLISSPQSQNQRSENPKKT
jgi:hypothetical protein